MRKIISQLHINEDGIVVCKDKTGKDHVVFKRQGDLDGACATYCVIMNLLILRLIYEKDTRVYEESVDKATRKLIKTFLKDNGMHINGQTFYKIKKMLKESFCKVDCTHYVSDGNSSLDYIEQTIKEDKPIIISISQTKWAHALLSVGFEKENDAMTKIFCLDPGGEPRRHKRWNMEIQVKNSGMESRPPTIIYDSKYVSLDDVIIISEVQ